MLEGEPSNTAMQVAAARAAHLRFDPTPHLIEDTHAEALLGEQASQLVAMYGPDAPWILHENRIFLPLRARFTEDRLRDAYASGLRQYVVLGAGLDCSGLRMAAELPELRVYEIDHPSTQAWRHARFEALGWTLPVGARAVACDFEHTRVSEALAQSDFDASAPALVSWLGVTYYLTPDAAAASLADLGALLAAGSEVVMDTMRPWEELPERYQALREEMAQYLKGVGEPQQNRYSEPALRAWVSESGFDEVLLPSREAISARYAEALHGEALRTERFRLVVARR